jgi:hypothetical protein
VVVVKNTIDCLLPELHISLSKVEDVRGVLVQLRLQLQLKPVQGFGLSGWRNWGLDERFLSERGGDVPAVSTLRAGPLGSSLEKLEAMTAPDVL